MIRIPNKLERVRDVDLTPKELIDFESRIKEQYETGNIPSPIHLSKNNEGELIQIFEYIDKDDWVFCSWRNHYHALLHGIPEDKLYNDIMGGRSMSTNSKEHNFYASSIVGGIIPLAVGTALGAKMKFSDKKVWCFIGDMTFETGIFYEAYKYVKNFDLPLQFVVEDNNLSVHTPTDTTWGVKKNIPSDVVYYRYENGYPHHGTGAWVNF